VTEWLILGRTDYAQPLRMEGTVEAESPERAAARTFEQKGRDWVELSLLPRSSVHYVLEASPRGLGAR
jgi:hypothetical protein